MQKSIIFPRTSPNWSPINQKFAISFFLGKKKHAPFPTPFLIFLGVLGSNQSWDATPCARDLRDITAMAYDGVWFQVKFQDHLVPMKFQVFDM